MDEIFSRLLAISNFHEVLRKYWSALISSTSPFEMWSNQNRCLIWSSLASPCGFVLSPPQHHLGHPLHVQHLLFRTPLLGAGETTSSFLVGGREPSKVVWERLVVFGHKCSVGEETSHQNLNIRNYFLSTYLNRSMSDVERSEKGDR